MTKKELKEEKLRVEFEKGFEEGYSVAKRLYKPACIRIYTESEESEMRDYRLTLKANQ